MDAVHAARMGLQLSDKDEPPCPRWGKRGGLFSAFSALSPPLSVKTLCGTALYQVMAVSIAAMGRAGNPSVLVVRWGCFFSIGGRFMIASSADRAGRLREAIDRRAAKIGKTLCLVEVRPGRFRICTYQAAGARRIVYRSDRGYTCD